MRWVLPFRRKPLTLEQALENYIEKLMAWEETEKLVVFHTRRTAHYAGDAADYAAEAALNIRKAVAKFAIVMTDEEDDQAF